MSTTGSFQLSKWYFDVLGEDGTGWVAYRANVNWNWLSFAYTGLIPVGIPQPGFSRFSDVDRFDEGNSISWKMREAEGKWVINSSPIRKTLLERDEGKVEWTCFSPDGPAELHYAGHSYNGRGYAEYLQLTIKPWHLPIRVLRWGRYISSKHSIIWIIWEGEMPLHLVWHNGTLCKVESISDTLLCFSDFRLSLPQTSFKNESLGDGVLGALTKLADHIPETLLKWKECKMFGAGMLCHGDTRRDAGQVIHEVVIM